MHYYSPRAYEYLRSTFNFNLPSIRSLRYWYSAINGDPGFTEEAFDALRQRVDQQKHDKNKKPLLVGLSFDEMFIRKHSQYDTAKKEFLGHITSGKPDQHEFYTPLCREALVFMVTGIEQEFKLPIGYFLTNGLSSEEKAALVKEALFRLYRIGIKPVSLTFDGAKSNITTMKLLGVDYNNDKPYFWHPYDKRSKVYVILDAPHMLKLCRNCLGNKGIIYDAEDRPIKWQYLYDLVSLQIQNNINLGNKLTKTHIEYDRCKMNVRIAAETCSLSTTASIDYVNKELELPEFTNSEATTEYMRWVNNSFDAMNTRRGHTGTDFKRPFSEATINEFSEYFNYARKYIKGLKLMQDGKKISILKTRSSTPFFGFYHNMKSFIDIYNDHIRPNGYDEFHTFDVSQDHLETFFGSIRSMGGSKYIHLFDIRE